MTAVKAVETEFKETGTVPAGHVFDPYARDPKDRLRAITKDEAKAVAAEPGETTEDAPATPGT